MGCAPTTHTHYRFVLFHIWGVDGMCPYHPHTLSLCLVSHLGSGWDVPLPPTHTIALSCFTSGEWMGCAPTTHTHYRFVLFHIWGVDGMCPYHPHTLSLCLVSHLGSGWDVPLPPTHTIALSCFTSGEWMGCAPTTHTHYRFVLFHIWGVDGMCPYHPHTLSLCLVSHLGSGWDVPLPPTHTIALSCFTSGEWMGRAPTTHTHYRFVLFHIWGVDGTCPYHPHTLSLCLVSHLGSGWDVPLPPTHTIALSCFTSGEWMGRAPTTHTHYRFDLFHIWGVDGMCPDHPHTLSLCLVSHLGSGWDVPLPPTHTIALSCFTSGEWMGRAPTTHTHYRFVLFHIWGVDGTCPYHPHTLSLCLVSHLGSGWDVPLPPTHTIALSCFTSGEWMGRAPTTHTHYRFVLFHIWGVDGMCPYHPHTLSLCLVSHLGSGWDVPLPPTHTIALSCFTSGEWMGCAPTTHTHYRFVLFHIWGVDGMCPDHPHTLSLCLVSHLGSGWDVPLPPTHTIALSCFTSGEWMGCAPTTHTHYRFVLFHIWGVDGTCPYHPHTLSLCLVSHLGSGWDVPLPPTHTIALSCFTSGEWMGRAPTTHTHDRFVLFHIWRVDGTCPYHPHALSLCLVSHLGSGWDVPLPPTRTIALSCFTSGEWMGCAPTTHTHYRFVLFHIWGVDGMCPYHPHALSLCLVSHLGSGWDVPLPPTRTIALSCFTSGEWMGRAPTTHTHYRFVLFHIWGVDGTCPYHPHTLSLCLVSHLGSGWDVPLPPTHTIALSCFTSGEWMGCAPTTHTHYRFVLFHIWGVDGTCPYHPHTLSLCLVSHLGSGWDVPLPPTHTIALSCFTSGEWMGRAPTTHTHYRFVLFHIRGVDGTCPYHPHTLSLCLVSHLGSGWDVPLPPTHTIALSCFTSGEWMGCAPTTHTHYRFVLFHIWGVDGMCPYHPPTLSLCLVSHLGSGWDVPLPPTHTIALSCFTSGEWMGRAPTTHTHYRFVLFHIWGVDGMCPYHPHTLSLCLVSHLGSGWDVLLPPTHTIALSCFTSGEWMGRAPTTHTHYRFVLFHIWGVDGTCPYHPHTLSLCLVSHLGSGWDVPLPPTHTIALSCFTSGEWMGCAPTTHTHYRFVLFHIWRVDGTCPYHPHALSLCLVSHLGSGWDVPLPPTRTIALSCFTSGEWMGCAPTTHTHYRFVLFHIWGVDGMCPYHPHALSLCLVSHLGSGWDVPLPPTRTIALSCFTSGEWMGCAPTTHTHYRFVLFHIWGVDGMCPYHPHTLSLCLVSHLGSGWDVPLPPTHTIALSCFTSGEWMGRAPTTHTHYRFVLFHIWGVDGMCPYHPHTLSLCLVSHLGSGWDVPLPPTHTIALSCFTSGEWMGCAPTTHTHDRFVLFNQRVLSCVESRCQFACSPFPAGGQRFGPLLSSCRLTPRR